MGATNIYQNLNTAYKWASDESKMQFKARKFQMFALRSQIYCNQNIQSHQGLTTQESN